MALAATVGARPAAPAGRPPPRWPAPPRPPNIAIPQGCYSAPSA